MVNVKSSTVEEIDLNSKKTEAMMKTQSMGFLSELAGAVVGTSLGLIAVGYGMFVLVTDSLRVIF